MLAHPWRRYNVFSYLMEFRIIRRELDISEETPHDFNLTEIICSMDDMVSGDPFAAVGSVLFDQEEATAFAKLLDMPLDWEKIDGDAAGRSHYLRGPEFMAVMDQADACISLMFAVGRGLPGWDHSFGRP